MEGKQDSGGCPHADTKSSTEGCPVEHGAKSGMMSAMGLSPSQEPNRQVHNTPANDMAFGQDRYPNQKIPLSRQRASSSIPNVSVCLGYLCIVWCVRLVEIELM